MKNLSLVASLTAASLLLCIPSQAGQFNRKEAAAARNLIVEGGKLSLGTAKWIRLKEKIYGKRRALKASETPLGMLKRKKGAKSKKAPKSIPVVIGDAPEGFGQYLHWDEADEDLAVIVFVNPADSIGVVIDGVRRGDTIEVYDAAGIASFSEDTENEGVAGFLTVVGVGAGITASAFGQPEFVPLINAATGFAKEQWKEKKVKSKRRDAFGEDPSSHHKAKQEGGILITLPARGVVGGPIYSGRDKQYWIKEPGDRIPKLYPPQVKNAFFVTRERKPHQATGDGEIFITAWDHIFEDNLGFYRLKLFLRRGSVPDPGNVE